MPRTITQTTTFTLYTYQELLEAETAGTIRGQDIDRARILLQEWQTDHDWADYARDMWTKALGFVGFENAEIQYSGFSSQGDGASFTANPQAGKLIVFLSRRWQPDPGYDDEDPRPWVCEKIGWSGGELKYKKLTRWLDSLDLGCVRGSSNHLHEHTCDFTARLTETVSKVAKTQEKAEALVQEFEARVEGLRMDLCQEIYATLESEYEYITSDEALTQFAEANEYLFDATGHIHHTDRGILEEPATPPVSPKLEPKTQLLARLQGKRRLQRNERQAD